MATSSLTKLPTKALSYLRRCCIFSFSSLVAVAVAKQNTWVVVDVDTLLEKEVIFFSL